MAVGTIATVSDVHVSKPLSNVSVLYRNKEFIADQAMPIIPVLKESDKYFVFGKENMVLPNTLRADGAEARESRYNVSTASYTLAEHALSDIVTDRMIENADAPLQPYIDTTEHLTEIIMIRREKEVADMIFNTTTFSGYTAAAGTQWDNASASPIVDVRTAISYVAKATGSVANAVIMGREVWDKLVDHPDIIDRIKHSQLGVSTSALIAQMFGVEKILVGSAVYNNTAIGAADNMAYIWGKYVLIAYISPRPSIRSASLGYIFSKRESGMMAKVKRWREEKRAGDMVEVSLMFAPVIVSAQSGYLYSSVVA